MHSFREKEEIKSFLTCGFTWDQSVELWMIEQSANKLRYEKRNTSCNLDYMNQRISELNDFLDRKWEEFKAENSQMGYYDDNTPTYRKFQQHLREALNY